MGLYTRQLIASFAALSVLAVSPASLFAAVPAPVEGKNGMVVTAQHLATDVGVEVLKAGGNAVDAAVAVAYTLAVTYPTAGNIGGGGFMTLRMADGRTDFLDFREKAPLAATKTMYLDDKGEIVPRASLDGYLAVGTPGTVKGLELAREKYGSKDRATLMAPAIALARDGFTLTQGDASILAGGAKRLAKDPEAAKIFLKSDGTPYGEGEVLKQPDLARVLGEISAKGPDAFYKGFAADSIVKASEAGKGILTKADFEQYKVREFKPVECDYRGYHIISSPPPSSGGVIICEILNILEAYPLASQGYGAASTVSQMAEAMRYAYVDRNAALGDPDFVKNPLPKMLDKAYAAEIRQKIDPGKAGKSADLKPFGGKESTETTHFSILDGKGNAVSVTYTLNGSFGAGVVAPGTGILLNNEMDDFTSKPGVPNLYGLVQGEANAIAPQKTPLSSMSPTIITRDGKPFMVIGSPGGSRIITITLEAILNVVDFGMDISMAVNAPRIHHQWQPDKIFYEPYALSPDTIKLLQSMGYTLDGGNDGPVWGQAAGILVGGKSLAEIDKAGAKATGMFGAIDARAVAGSAKGY
ncbi:gamma-glutamyltransferase [Rhizobium paknamense]|uniref:Glutathione hydrolase proenzyme n=1 Tax=Rhizobium paknamense TaxID=1206817 RepID=A0ABU0IBX8_9HYPH|nr:gamma-glutamyltransferase [Rhizobium paknamense]MDQ0455197.1 gamma-glutamyltranspeptidase/glutathione hydrolase [Rhizobium paknamense]